MCVCNVNSHTMHKISMKSNASTCTNLAAEMYLHFAKEMHSLSPVHLHKKNVAAISITKHSFSTSVYK